ncbi:MAG: PPOX class F420-dependent oxidoreductase [Chloroflexota bacterium]|nr:PPOX class F420-dependent oxidoreductase [Chloroflexota bacterium]
MNCEQALEYLRENHRGVLTTQRRDGRPQLSNVAYLYDAEDGKVKISVTEDRAKTRNVRRDPRVSMLVLGPNWYEYVVVEGMGSILDQNPVPELRRVYEGISGGPHPNWQEFDEAMVRDRRVVLSIAIERMYPISDE